LTTAQPPAEASSPKILINTALSVFLGALLAIGVALLLELNDRRVRSAEDAVAVLGLPVLGTLPKPNAKRFAAGHLGLPVASRVMALSAPNSPSQGT
jgi:capsular polysaccharide biosynthesis protein